MHQARPYGLAVYGGDLSEDDHLFIARLATVVSNYKATTQLESVKYTRELPDGGFVVIQDAGGVFRAIAYKDRHIDEPELRYDGLAPGEIPMLFSACIDEGIVRMGAGVELKMTDMCQLRLGNYESRLGGTMRLQRFRCDYTPLMEMMFVPSALRGLPKENLMFTQYDKLKASWYSGAMSEVVQIVSGYGRQDIVNLPEDPVERAQFILPAKVQEQINQSLDQVRLPGYTGQADDEGKIQYSFLFNQTHLVSFDNQNRPWLVQVDSSGVWAMPLPMIPATCTQAFHDYIQEKGDHEIQKILDRFGGMPSGENFPQGAEFSRWQRAGVIVRVCDSSDFFKHSAYSSVTGWSCNEDGSRLINTCYDYVNDFCYGYTFQIELNLVAAEHHGWSYAKTLEGLSEQQMALIAQYMGRLNERLEDTEHYLKIPSIKYKLRRVDVEELLERASGRFSDAEIDYWDNYVCDPIASHSGKTVCSNQGYLFGGMTLKLPEPLLEGCISMSFAPLFEMNENIRVPKVDTIVYAYYEGNTQKVIKNFWDERKVVKDVEGNFEDEMIVGNWEQTEYSGLTGLEGNFYSTDFDHRQEIAPTEIHTVTEGRDVGYGTPYANYTAFFYAVGVLSRWRYYSHKTIRTVKYGKMINMCFVIPMCQRNAVLYGYREQSDRETVTESVNRQSVQDPHSYLIWTYDAALHWIDSARNAGPFVKKAMPYPVDSVPVWAEVHNFNHDGSAAADFADSGDWVGGLPADVTHLVNPPGGVTSLTYGGVPPNVLTYTETTEKPYTHQSELHFGMFDPPRLINREPQRNEYYTISPDRYGNVLYVDACRVVFGEMQYGNIDVNTANDRRFFVGYSKLCNHKYAHTFIGVINE